MDAVPLANLPADHVVEAVLHNGTDERGTCYRSLTNVTLFRDLWYIIFGFAFTPIDLQGSLYEVMPYARGIIRNELSCLLVCTSWRDTVIPMVYKHIVLHRREQLPLLLRTLKGDSNLFDFKMMVKHLTIAYPKIGLPQSDYESLAMTEEILSICPTLKQLKYGPYVSFPSFSQTRTPMEMIRDPVLLSSVTSLSLGSLVPSNRHLLQFLAGMPQLVELSFHNSLCGEQAESQLPCIADLPFLKHLALTLHSPSVLTFVHQLSAPSLSRLLIHFDCGWNDSSDDAIVDITSSKGGSVACLQIHWNTLTSQEPQLKTFDTQLISHCPILQHLVINGTSYFEGTHLNLRFIDIWRDVEPEPHWDAVDPETESQLHAKALQASFPNLEKVRILDARLRDLPDLPNILPPTRHTENNLRLRLFSVVVWDTPTLVFREELLRGLSGPSAIDTFVSWVYKCIDAPYTPDTYSDTESDYEGDEYDFIVSWDGSSGSDSDEDIFDHFNAMEDS
ncbi:hypothetical protein NEOLEDRAFT_1171679 [Neolentinus lepideus HHB14362 ss-1]|uniref:F-box domain-containing protein n=1 Tax=Neolentinus lepideus HHB14362 ss-1 TaxID=1314782 RepID=A0A165Q5B2_9AGAM|nr:hypothetical protein NEOLEDRAFT_1171679 [Neolentinus lepideus HHB14362 ss-1]